MRIVSELCSEIVCSDIRVLTFLTQFPFEKSVMVSIFHQTNTSRKQDERVRIWRRFNIPECVKKKNNNNLLFCERERERELIRRIS